MVANKSTNNLIKFLCSPVEKADEDLAISFFRDLFGSKFTRQKEAERSDGYVAGNLVLELKGTSSDWLSGLLQGIAYGKELDFTKVVVAAHEFLAVWYLSDIPTDILDEVSAATGAPNAVGKKLAQKFRSQKKSILESAAFHLDSDYLPSKDTILKYLGDELNSNIDRFVKVLKTPARQRQRVTLKNFTNVLKNMVAFFDEKQPLAPVRAFYSIIFGWDEGSKVQLSDKKRDSASVNGETVTGLKPDRRQEFKRFVEDRYVSDDKVPSKDVFFAHFDQALDAVDKDFRIKHGIFFTDLDLSRFAMWYVKQNLGDIGKDYLVIDPACGSGNLVTNWRSPLELRHKVVSEIEPELLFAVERRMQGDEWHNGKFTVVPSVAEGIGLNFIDRDASDYLEVLKSHLVAKGLKPNRPIAFLCNPPYRTDDDQTASSVEYPVHPSIVDLTGGDAVTERYCCFLAQMKLMCEKAEDSGLPSESLMLLFTTTSWLTDRASFSKIRNNILGSFEDVAGFMINSKQFFEVSGNFPIAFTIWKYRGSNANLNPNRHVSLVDLTWLRKNDLSSIDWETQSVFDDNCSRFIQDRRSVHVPFGLARKDIKSWSGEKMLDFKRSRTKAEIEQPRCGGLPKGDSRNSNKKAYGNERGNILGFMDDLTPVRISKGQNNKPWFRLNKQFMECSRARCLSGPPDNRGYFASDKTSAQKLFTWYALSRIFKQLRYPDWAHNMEMWAPSETPEIVQMSYAIGFAENECVETIFPANNPIRGTQEIYVSNPLSPNTASSFWSTVMRPVFDEGSSPAHELVKTIENLYKVWGKHLNSNHEIRVTYDKPYFIGKGKLTKNSGLIQIRDYAKERDISVLLAEFEKVQSLLSKVKKAFHEMLLDKNRLNYFGQPNVSTVTAQAIEKELRTTDKSRFDKVLDLRLAVSAKIVDTLKDDVNFGRVKFAKILYLAEKCADLNLDTNYVREVAGPLDQRALYNEKIGIEPLAEKNFIFTSKTKSIVVEGEKRKVVRYMPAKRLSEFSAALDGELGDKSKIREIQRVLKLVEPMTTDQIEIVATLYAAWNDLLLKNKGKQIEDKKIITEFRENWHEKKKRFTEAQLTKALDWMRKHKIVPTGTGKATSIKRTDDLDF